MQSQTLPAEPQYLAGKIIGVVAVGAAVHALITAQVLLSSQSSWLLSEILVPVAVETALATFLIGALALPLTALSRTRRAALPMAGLVALALVGSRLAIHPPAPRHQKPGPSTDLRTVVLITLDTFRRDHLSAMPDALAPDLTPNLDRLAAESVLFIDATTTAPLTLPSHTTLLTGLPPQAHGVLRNGVHVPEGLAGVPVELADHGYLTGAFTSSLVLHGSHGLARWFHTYRNTPESLDLTDAMLLSGPIMRRLRDARTPTKLGKSSGETTVSQAAGWLRTVPHDRSVFLWVHFYDTHTPHSAHEGSRGASTWAGLANPCNWSAHPTAVRRPRDHPLVPFTETLPPLDLCAKKAWTKLQKRAASYAEEVRFLDRQIGRLVEALDATGRSDAKLIIAADHGESLVEHQFFTSHQHSLYDPVMRVPLIVRDLDCADCAGKRVSEAVSTVRVAATIRHLAGLPPDASIAGPSLLASSPEPDQVAIGPAPVQRHGTSDFPLQAVVRSGGRKVLVDDRGHIERYALESDMLERDPLLLAHEQSALQIAVDDRLHPKKLPVSDRDPIQHMIFGGFRAKRGQPGLDLVLDQPGVLGELITDEQADPFHALEDRARRALESAHNRDAPTEEGLSNEVRESLEALGYLQ